MYVEFVRSWFYPNLVGGYTVSKSKGSLRCVIDQGLSHTPVFLKSDFNELKSFFGCSYDFGNHSTLAAKKTGLYGKKYVRFENKKTKRKVKIINHEEEMIDVEIEEVLVATFTLDDNGLVETYSVVKHEEPTQ